MLEFGGRNRGKPTDSLKIGTYFNECPSLSNLKLPNANVKAFQQDYILWEKLTALHQFCTQIKDPNPIRLARHWYDVDCLLQNQFADPLSTVEAMHAVIEMKKHRWPTQGVNYEAILQGGLLLIPQGKRGLSIGKDHLAAVTGQMFFNTPDDFKTILVRLRSSQDAFNQHIKS